MIAQTTAQVLDAYEARRGTLLARIAVEERLGARLGIVRLVTFALAAVGWWNALRSGSAMPIVWGVVASVATIGTRMSPPSPAGFPQVVHTG